jgi:hypothetical protein
MSSPSEAFDKSFVTFVEQVSTADLESEEATVAMRNLEIFSKCRPPLSILEPEPVPDAVPTTVWGRVRARMAGVWDNETTRVFIKAGGAFAGVALVAYSTIHRDHVLERQALAQANQRPS